MKKNAIEGNLEKIPGDIFVKHYNNLKQIKKDYMVLEKDGSAIDCRWYHGVSGAGKSRSAWEEFPKAYPKQTNQWWDGYQNEEAVIMDDLDIYDKKLGGDLKRWADRYKCIG